MSWDAVRMIARSQIRRHWVSMVVLGLLAGLVGGIGTGASAVARRTATAYDRLAAATHLDDARVLVFSDSVDVDAIARWPEVRESWQSRQVIGALVGGPMAFVSVSTGPPRPRDLFTPVLVDGRQPHDDAPDEVLVPSLLADEMGLRVGDTLPLKLLTPEEVTQFDTGFGEADGPRVDLRVVGIARVARGWVGNGMGPVIGTPALGRAYATSLIGRNILVRLAGGKDGVADFARRVDRLRRGTPTGAAGEEFGVLQAAYPTSEEDPRVTTATSTLVAGQLVFVVLAVLGGLLAVGQGLGRHHGQGAGEQQVEAALGLTRAERVWARVLPALLGAAVAGTVTVAGGVVAGVVEPLGALRAYEPEPGWRADAWVVVVGAVLVVVAFLGLAALTAARVTRPVGAAALPARRLGLAALGRRAPVAAGMAFALRGGHGRGAVPARTTLLVVVLGLAGVVGVSAFAASLDRLGDTPARYGWQADFAIVDSKPFDLEDLARDDRVAALLDTAATPVDLDGRRMQSISLRPLKGEIPLPVLEGRLPAADDEVAYGAREADRAGVAVGSTVRLATRSADGERSYRSLRVVGTAVIPDVGNDGLSRGVVLTARTQAAGAQSTPFTNALVEVAPGVGAGFFGSLAQRLEMMPAVRPAEVSNLVALGRLPVLLAGFLALLTAAVLAHSLVLTVRRRASELAVLRVVGLTPAQVGAALVAMAATIGLVGLAVGPLLGLAAGRLVWGEVAHTIGVAGDLAVPWPVLGWAAPVVLVGTALIALLPARRAARLRPATVLHSE